MKKNWYTSKIALWIFVGLALGILVVSWACSIRMDSTPLSPRLI